jgi:RNA polymerase sigma-70 factor, ECF subfamily
VVRLSLDELQSARARRETYVGPWLPEPLVIDDTDPAVATELADSLSMAFLVLLETLTPLERAAFLLREVFSYDYDEIATMIDRKPAACRQLVTRARRHVAQRRQRFDADRRRGSELARAFVAACMSGDVDTVMSMLAEDATLVTDGGGVVKAARRPIIGARKAARFLVAVAPNVPASATLHEAVINGQPGLLVVDGSAAYMTMAFEVIDDRIVGIRVVSNPEKLAAIPIRSSP